VIITDGDPVRRVRDEQRQVYAGLRRAVRLMPEADEALDQDPAGSEMPLSELIDSLVSGTGLDPQGTLLTARLRAAAEGDVFVGIDTLEVDIAPMLEGQMTDAFGELRSSSRTVGSFNSAVEAIANDVGTAEDRDELLRRIEEIGKGRFAQRLAEHIAASSGLGEWIAEPFTSPEPGDGTSQREISAEDLMKNDSFGYLLAALDRVSRMVRRRGLLPMDDSPFPEDGDD
jgi:putative ATP-dependent endonuclease of OLD family